MTPEQLKNSILQLAIQGKLVEQRKEEYVSTEFNAKKNIGMNALEFEIPNSWKASTIEGISKVISTKRYQIKESEILKNGLYPVISQSKEIVIGYSNEKNKLLVIKKPVIIFGDHTTVVKYIDFDFVVGADGIKIFDPISDIDPKFFKYSIDFLSIGLEKKGGYSRHYKFIKNLSMPVPPLAEQKRIVEKIEEILPLVDKYENTWNKLEEINKKFPFDMQKSILQEAIQGKLVEQRAEEGTGEELFKEIQKEKQKLIEEGKLKKQKALHEITEDEIPFDIPETWKWVRLGEIGVANIGLTYKPTEISNDGTIVLRSSNIQNGKLDFSDIVRVNKDISEAKMCQVGDILICARNGSKKLVGKAALINLEGMSFGAFMAIYRSICNEYVLHFINSTYFKNALLPETGTTTINQITQDSLKSCVIPLPPFAEQKRIVEKIEDLLPLCEKLK